MVAPRDPYFAFFSEQASGSVALFEVDNVHVEHSDLIAAEIEVIGSIDRDSNWEWLHFRAPDATSTISPADTENDLTVCGRR